MMEKTLRKRLHQVTSRFQERRLGWLLALIAIAFAGLAWGLLPAARAGQIMGSQTAVVLLSVAALSMLVAWAMTRRSFSDPHSIASKIESKFPSLQQRLLTAVSLSLRQENSSGYLQQRVIREACDHSQRHRWTETVPQSQLWISRMSGFSATLVMALMLGMLFVTSSDPSQVGASVTRRNQSDAIVDPGNAEIERNTSLVVTARFESIAPSEAELRVIARDGSEQRLTMKQNLQDPVLAAFLSSVDDDFEYQILTRDWSSQTYSIRVFEFPKLVRSDALLDFPEYTGMDDKRIDDTVRVTAVEGTMLTWYCHLNKPVASATLVEKDGARTPLQPMDRATGDGMVVQLQMEQTKRYTLELVDHEGRKNKYPVELVAKVLPNQSAKIKLTQGGDVSVSPLEELSLAADVADDFGLHRVGISYNFEGEATEIVFDATDTAKRKQRFSHMVEFESLNAKPDQLLAYHFWAEDIGPGGVVRRTQSDMYFAEVRPFEEIYREGEPPPSGQTPPSENEQAAEELAELQKQIINATWRVIRDENGVEVSIEFAKNVKETLEGQLNAIELLAELAAKLSDPESQLIVQGIREHMQTAADKLEKSHQSNTTDTLANALASEQASYAGLLKLRAREFQVTRAQQRSQSSSSSSSSQRQKQLNELELDQDENRYETAQQAEANSPEAAQQRAERQVLSRLRELAQRQEDINKQLAQLQSALELAKTEKEKEEIRRQLKRLREQQQNLLRETDELAERMQSPENQESMQQQREQLEETRENQRRASEALQQEDASSALAAGKRAERDLDELQDEFRQRTSGQFSDAMREMRADAQTLDQKQQRLSEALRAESDNPSPGLRRNEQQQQLENQLDEQRRDLSQLENKMQETVEQAESVEPLLAKELYDSFRNLQQREVDRRLEETSELVKAGFTEEARRSETAATEGVKSLREEIEQAASSILGDETEGLKRAANTLEQLARDLEQEIEEERGEGRRGEGELGEGENGAGQRSPQEEEGQRESEGRSEQSGESSSEQNEGQGQQGQTQGQSEGQGQSSGQSMRPGPNESENESPGRAQAAGQTGLRSATPSQSRVAAQSPSGSPIAGDGFREWSDQLRDVEEMVEDPELRSRASQIRDRAREARTDLLRHSKPPQWNLIEDMIADPLRELQRDVQEEFMRRSAEKNSQVPVDRDPVPSQFSEAVRQYYENLGSGRGQ
ncbi:putative membrane protein [Rhodopirellula maiorica SM1]|uniref:Putative membrane protein n=1 Tax=Rhodopirellula maiorica SM1 TaxID=1265738 RepID=M5RYD9_9BACT|nr:membrane protein [Rhodopirellula maiorica]EMI20412.1 putative membrane protein [Rhodopirellula maiorica SM1]